MQTERVFIVTTSTNDFQQAVNWTGKNVISICLLDLAT